ncbi:MAG: hydantoinase/oxoprolinase family protein [Hyphomicrobiales bacterium]|nr:hydantoinase/oxoprolinase family protein [Hyphomicrobiales bacterium]MCP5370258.1 hydantoinase/oxoprolinase family protein [Hyphomicrobiales bacterium]
MRIGIDIGGTFTDIVGNTGDRLFYAKAPSSEDIVQGVGDGVKLMLKSAGIDPAQSKIEIEHVHGTTVATNALLESKGAKIAVLGTLGHQDALELGRMKRGQLYDLHRDAETPWHLAPGRVRIGIRERVDGRGNIQMPLDEDQVVSEVSRLVARYGIESIAVCYLNSHLNPTHERRTGEILEEKFPDITVSLSCVVNPTFREYERVCCTAFDAYVRPIVERYVAQLATHLDEGDRNLNLMQSRGGIASAEMVTHRPVSMFLSGPAGGVVGSLYTGRLSDRKNLITFDVGGTSTDVALVRDGRISISQEGRIDRFPLRVPMVGLETIGSGGGSIAWVDAGGGLRVGPQSAGSNPGPACYGRGGTEPTATDALLVLGYLNPGWFADGTMTLDAGASHQAIEDLAGKIGLSKIETALGIYRILVSQMADAISLVTVKKGEDPRKFTLLSFGGGGGMFSAAIAQSLGIREVLVPRSPGTLSAFGLLVSNFEIDKVVSHYVKSPREADTAAIEIAYQALEKEGAADLETNGSKTARIEFRRSADIRYSGQAYEIETMVPDGEFDAAALKQLTDNFHAEHEKVYGYSDTSRDFEIIALRCVAFRRPPETSREVLIGELPSGGDQAPVEVRRITLEGAGEVDCPIYRRTSMSIDNPIEGPCIIEQSDTTTLVLAGQSVHVDDARNMFIQGMK